MAELIAVALPGGPDFVAALQRVWDAGDAVLPLDLRLPASARSALLTELRPAAVIDDRGRTALPNSRPVQTSDALVMATSGTTGSPKGVTLTHAAVAASAQATSTALDVDPAHDHWLACLPLAHVGGLSVVTRALHTGTRLTTLPTFDAAAIAAASDTTLISLVPAALDGVDATRFRRILLGGSAIPSERPANSIATYGMTETGSGVIYDGYALDGVELRIVDDEIHVRGPMLLRCYRSSDGDVDPVDADGWFATGDGGSLAADGQLTVYGRSGDMIVTGGENVWPVAVERVLIGHPSVAEVAVVGRSDDRWGQRVVALVVPAANTTPTLDVLRDHVKNTLPAFCAPQQLDVVARLPRTALGKVRRTDL